MYGEFCQDRGENASGRLAENWQKYLEAVDKVRRVRYELEEHGEI